MTLPTLVYFGHLLRVGNVAFAAFVVDVHLKEIARDDTHPAFRWICAFLFFETALFLASTFRDCLLGCSRSNDKNTDNRLLRRIMDRERNVERFVRAFFALSLVIDVVGLIVWGSFENDGAEELRERCAIVASASALITVFRTACMCACERDTTGERVADESDDGL